MGTHRTVLLIKNSRIQQLILKRSLQNLGFKVETVDSGEEAISLLKDMPIGFVLCDRHLGDMDGFELCRTLRRDERLAGLPFVLMVSKLSLDDILMALMAGVHRIVPVTSPDESFVKSIIDEFSAICGGSEKSEFNPVDIVLNQCIVPIPGPAQLAIRLLFNALVDSGLRSHDDDHLTNPSPSTSENVAQLTVNEANSFDQALDFENLSTALGKLANRNVLLVDDEPINRKVSQALLEKLGLSVDTCVNGKEAVDYLTETDKNYCLILMDQWMPEMNGDEAIQQIRQLEKWVSVPVVALSASSDLKSVQQYLRAGMDDFVEKSADPTPMYRTLSKWLLNENRASKAEREPPISHGSSVNRYMDAQGQSLSAVTLLNAKTALLLVDGDLEKLTALLEEFISRFNHFSDEFDHVFDATDTPSAQRLAHSLKGVAATLGLVEIAREAAQLEDMLRTATQKPTQTVTAIVDLIDQFRLEFDQWRATQSFSSTSYDGTLLTLIVELVRLLESDNPKAYDHYMQHKGSFDSANASISKHLGDLIANYNLVEALDYIKHQQHNLVVGAEHG